MPAIHDKVHDEPKDPQRPDMLRPGRVDTVYDTDRNRNVAVMVPSGTVVANDETVLDKNNDCARFAFLPDIEAVLEWSHMNALYMGNVVRADLDESNRR